ncbi:MAG: hypothetical protein KQA41_01150 [Candidatus Aenigmarchaeota archaeon]|nr:hypothetical protein [Candidatus Aenigmarchaeota archaeon]MBU5688819.1 hypothetical protein [Candidatus Aenigmarchaeota archaeon]
MFGKKSQSSLIIIVGIISVAVLLWIFNLYKQTSDTKEFLKNLKISKIQEYLEMFKGYTRNSLILSAHKSTIEISKKGGNPFREPIRTWICTDPIYPSVNEIRYFLSESTKNSLNSYLLNANKSKQTEDIKILIDPSTCVDYDVSDSSLMKGENDEKFNVGAYGSHIYINYDFDAVNSTNSVYEEITRDRFWYIYRNFREWASKNTFKKYVCQCMNLICKCDKSGSCSEKCLVFEECINNALNNALNDLQKSFDEYVECGYVKNCCYQEKQSCGDVAGCTNWENPPQCNKCNYGNPDKLCTANDLTLSSNEKKSYFYEEYYTPRMALPQEPEDTCADKKVEMWNTVKASTEAIFSCVDKKYVLSSPEKYITFNVHVQMSLQSRQCYSEGQCTCKWNCEINPSTGKCLDGKEPKCLECVPTELAGHWCTECKASSSKPVSEPIALDFKQVNVPINYKTYSGNYQQIFEQIKSEMGLNVNLYNDVGCIKISDSAWCWTTSEGCNGFGVYCKFNVLQKLPEEKLNILFRHELTHVVQSLYYHCNSRTQLEWGADYYAGSNYYDFKFNDDTNCIKAPEVTQELLGKWCTEDEIKKAAICDPSISVNCLNAFKSLHFC